MRTPARRWGMAVGALALSGVSCMAASWWCGLADVTRYELFGRALAAWFCAGPLVGAAAGWYLRARLGQGWRGARMEDL